MPPEQRRADSPMRRNALNRREGITCGSVGTRTHFAPLSGLPLGEGQRRISVLSLASMKLIQSTTSLETLFTFLQGCSRNPSRNCDRRS